MVDSMMIGRNFDNIDPQSNFTGPNTLAEMSDWELIKAFTPKKENNMSYPVTAATEAVKRAESVSRKFARAQYSLEAAIRDLQKAGFLTLALENQLQDVKEARNIARVKRGLARDALKEAALKATDNLYGSGALQPGDLEDETYTADEYLHNTI